MTKALRAFMEGLIDYAGLFPPARLSMPEAVATYSRHLRAEHAWMVGRFVCPISKLTDFRSEGENVLVDQTPIRVAGIASRARDRQALKPIAQADAAQAVAFAESGWGRVDVFETRLPDDLWAGSDDDIHEALTSYETVLEAAGLEMERVYYEIGRTRSWEKDVGRCVQALARHEKRGFKIRCGGVTPDAYPSVGEVALAIEVCAQAKVPFKATAGLHHPLRHVVPETGIVQHGFINVFSAGILAFGDHNADTGELVDDRGWDHFGFTDENLNWKNNVASVDEIRAARSVFATSYGSCNIDEPVEDLRKSGHL
jgi:hypothetical protein